MEKNSPKNHPDAGNMPSQNTNEDFDRKTSNAGEMTKRKSYQKDNVVKDESDDDENEDEVTDEMDEVDEVDEDQNSSAEADEAAGEEFIDKDPTRKPRKEGS